MKTNLLVITLVAVAALSFCPAGTQGSTAVKSQQQQQQAGQTAEIWQEDEQEVLLIRNERGAKNKDGLGGGGGSGPGKKGKGKKQKNHKVTTIQPPNSELHANNKKDKNRQNTPPIDPSRSCRYVKSAWSDCDPKTNQRTRTLTLKRGEEGCVQTRTIQKKCKKACRYEKGSWTECISGKMSRVDRLKSGNPELATTCEATRTVNKNCNPGKNNKNGEKNKENRQSKDKGGRNKSRA